MVIIKNKDKNENKEPIEGSYIPLGISIGISIGVALGLTVFDNLVLGIGIGIALGTTVGAGIDENKRKKISEDGKLYPAVCSGLVKTPF